MPFEIHAITLPLPYRLGGVNCYLLRKGVEYFLIDTGSSNARRELEEQLRTKGCQPGNLKLIILTHGDFDHTGNAAYLRKKYASKIAMHLEDSGMSEQGDMLFNRRLGNAFTRALIKITASCLFGFGRAERFKPDLYIDEVFALSEYGLDARIIHTPGHSKGSISILTSDRDLFCGDLCVNGNREDNARMNTIVDQKTYMNESTRRLKDLNIRTIYPGHGRPFLSVKLFGADES